MEINFNNLKDVARYNAHLYLLNSEHYTLLQSATKFIERHHNQQQQFSSERILINPDEIPNLAELSQSSLFDPQKILILTCNFQKLNQDLKKIISTAAQYANPKLIIVLRINFMLSKKEKTQWLQKIQAKILVLSLYALQGVQYTRWLNAALKHYQLNFDNDALQVFISQTEAQHDLAIQNLKILQLLNASPITTAELQGLEFNPTCTIWELSKHFLLRNYPQAIKVLQSLKNINYTPLLVTWHLYNDVINLYKVVTATQAGSNLQAIKQQLPFYKAQNILQAQHKWQQVELENLLNSYYQLDKLLKSDYNPAKQWELITQWIFSYRSNHVILCNN